MVNQDTYSQLIENLTSAVLVLDRARQVVFANPSAEVLFEASRKRLQGLSAEVFFAGDGDELELLHTISKTGHRFSKREAQMLTLTGQKIVTDYSVSPLADGFLLIEANPRDRLLRIEREEELLNRQASASGLIRGLAHEIKNPLGGIRGAAQLLERELPSEDLKEFTRIIIDEADRLRNLVDRMMGPHRRPVISQVNIHAVLEHVRSLLEVESQGQLKLVRDYDPSLPEFSGDYEQLIQAVLNICQNAYQALNRASTEDPTITLRTRALRRITLGTEQHRLVCCVEIIDNGPGIPSELLDKVFFPMVTGRAEGTGLGLSIAQSIVNQHSGLVECQSEPGCTSFQIYLPLES